jgi:dTDP-glucose pyrophosphorylase
MNFVIPMAGRGQRFVDAGYMQPKMLIEAHGKTLLQWSVGSLPLELCESLVFVGLEDHERAFGISKRIREWYGHVPRLDFVFLPSATGGQAETVLRARDVIDPGMPLLIFNIDTMFRSATLAAALQRPSNDGVLGSFHSREPRFSFAAIDDQGLVTRVTEKDPISEHALTGLYFFRDTILFLELADACVRRNERTKGEFYVAPLYNELLARGKRVVIDTCGSHAILGTPAELAAFDAAPFQQGRAARQ